MSAASPQVETTSPRTRSRVSNGTSLFDPDAVDGRSAPARRYRDLVADLTAHLGGSPSAAELLLLRRAATLAVWAEAAEEAMIAGRDNLDVASFTTSVNTLRRLLADLGLAARMKDVTPSLESYLAQRRQTA
jgi:hypothetical protein